MIETLHSSPGGQDLLAATGFLASAGLALSVAGPNDWYRRESPELGQACRRTGVSGVADMIALVIMGQRKRTGLLADNSDAGVGQVSRGRPVGKHAPVAFLSNEEYAAVAGQNGKGAVLRFLQRRLKMNPNKRRMKTSAQPMLTSKVCA